LIEKLLARIATDKIIVISPQQLREIHEEVGVGRRDQFQIIPLGIDLAALDSLEERRTAFRNDIQATDDETIVGFVGRLTEIKDVSLYLNVAAAIQAYPAGRKTRFVVAGDGHLRQALEREANELGLDGIVIFLGNRPDVTDVYAGLDIVSLTSFNEGTPLSLIEAMAARRPVISTMVGGVRDLLGEVTDEMDGFRVCERGIAVDGRNVADYTKGLIYLIENIRLRKSLAEKGRAFVEATYSKDRLVNDIAQLYRSLTAKN
jgi:glycosyltransferase involved in cell wall biosynthesis